MRNYIIPAAIAAVLVSAPAAAHDGQLYVGADIGAIMPRDTEVDIKDVGTGAEFNNAVDLQYNTGFEIAGQFGYDFGMFRAEGELGFKHAGFDAIDPSTDWVNFLQNHVPGVIVDPSDIDLNDGLDIINVMANGLVDIGSDTSFGAYIGGGVGVGFAKAYGESNSSFAWQLIAGIRYPIAKDLDIGLKYKYFDMSAIDFTTGVDVQGTNFSSNLDGNFRTHSILANLTYHF